MSKMVSNEEEHFLRIVYLNFRVATGAITRFFDKLHPNLSADLNIPQNKAILLQLYNPPSGKKRVLFQGQWNILYPSPGLQNMLVISVINDIKAINMDTGEVSYLLTDLQSQILSMDYDYKNMHIYIPRYNQNDISRFRYPSEELHELEFVTYANTPTGLAIDPVGYHLYWTEDLEGNLFRCNLDGSKKRMILRDDTPFALMIDFKERWLYYSTVGFHRTISRSRMDGSQSHVFFDVKTEAVTGITLDDKNGRLYWVEHNAGVLKSTDINRTTVLDISSSISPKESFGMYAYAGDVYCSSGNQLLKFMLSGGNSIPTVVFSEDTDSIRGVLYINQRDQYPVVNTISNYYVVDIGSSFTAECSFKTPVWSPVREIYWQLNNSGVITQIVKETEGISGSSIETPSLTIFEVTSSESGTYTCYAKNDLGTGHSIPIYVTLTGDVPVILVGDSNYSIGYGEEITLSCDIKSEPPANNVYWEKINNGIKNILNNWTVGIQGVSVDTPSLTIVESTTADKGTYRCVAINDVGTGYSKTIMLDVIGELPTVTVTADSQEIKYGEKVQIVCIINANPHPTNVYWEITSNGITKVLSNGTSGTAGITIDNPSITLLHATDLDSGLYKCFAVNYFGMGYSSSTKLTVIGGLPEVFVPSITHLTGTGYTITLTCVIRNAFPVVSKVYWQRYINGYTTIISSSSLGYLGVTVENPSLIIVSAKESLTGEYTCFAVNSVGTGSSLPALLRVEAGVTTNMPIEDDEGKQNHSTLNTIIGAVSAAGGVGLCIFAYLTYKLTRRTVGTNGISTANNIGLDQNDSSNGNLSRNIRHSELQTETEE